MNAKRPYLIAYDIRKPKRLRRVHRVVRRYGVAVQYSVFLARLNGLGLQALTRELGDEIDPRFDDVRIYPVPTPVEITMLGQQMLPDGMILADEQIEPFFAAAIGRNGGTD